MRPVLDGYCRAMAGAGVACVDELVHRSIGWTRPELPSCDGKHVYLPAALSVPGIQASEQAFLWYKVMATYQAAHLELGGFQLRWADIASDARHEPETPPTSQLTDYGRFFSSFSRPLLARDLFAVAEAVRVDAHVLRAYSGLAPAYLEVRAACLAQRPTATEQSECEVAVEALVRLSLADALPDALSVARPLVGAAHQLLQPLRRLHATVADSARVTTALYALLAAGHADGDVGYRSSEPVLYRGVFKPELGQLLSRIEPTHEAYAEFKQDHLDQRTQLEQLVRESPELEVSDSAAGEDARETVLDNLEQELGAPGSHSEQKEGAPGEADDAALSATEPGSFVYDEWDGERGRYRARFCRVRERRLPSRDDGWFESTLHKHGALVRQIRRELEAIAQQRDQRQLRAKDGDEIDLDAALEAMVDRRSGRSPHENVFMRRGKVERDLAAAFLLDMSSSTADPIEAGADRFARGTLRVIDVQKEALALMVEALGQLGDRCGIYGFSGYGRKNVELFVVKELHEPMSREVHGRIAAITPQSATRMGTAVRHVAHKLLRHEARSRFLFLISDGKPHDQGYGHDDRSQRYAVDDTRMALLEARRHGVTPCCLTVDKQGHDYLGAMLQDLYYDVVWDAAMLPERLFALYRTLTV